MARQYPACRRAAIGVGRGQDIELVGTVDDLPQPTGRGTRFAFAVAKILTPDAVVPSRLSLAWYNDAPAEGELASLD